MPLPTGNDIEKAVALLRAGQVVGMPTETVYGLAADAMNPQAAARIFAAKQRPLFDPLIVHAADREGANACVSPEAWNPLAEALAAAFWPGPLTLVLPKRETIPDLVTSGLPFVAIRVPAHPLARELLRAFGGPLAAPSANRFGRVSPTTAAAVREELGDAVPLVLDGGPCAVGLESTIVAFPEGRPVLLRAGGVPVEALEKIVGPVSLEKKARTAAAAPGQLPQHYAPRTPLRLVASPDEIPATERARTGLLGWGALDGTGFARIENLSERGDFTEAAARFFAALRRLDGGGTEIREIAAILLPESDLGRAINDRLRRAAHS